MTDPVRTLFVIPNFGRNGAVDFIVDLASALAVLGVDVEILALHGAPRDSRLPNESVKISLGLAEQSRGARKASATRRIRRVLRLLSLTGKVIRSVLRSDIVMLTWEHGDALRLPSLVACALRRPTVAIVQNNIEQSLRDYSHSSGLGFLRWSYGRSRAVVYISQDQLPLLREVGVCHSKLVLIPNAIDLGRVREQSRKPRVTALPADEVPYVVGVGRLSLQKGFDLLIQAHAEVIRRGFLHRLVLIGNGPNKESLQALANRYGLTDSVFFLGYMTNPYPTIIRSSLYCLSSRYEGRPLVLSEAALLGVPMVATNCRTGPREILAGGLYGDLVETESVEALADAIEKHLRDPQRLIAKAQASARDAERLSINSCARRYVTLIGEHV